MLAALGALLLAAAPVKVAVPGFTVVGMDTALGEAWAESFVTLLGRDGDLKLITSKDIGQVLGLERQKQLLGCGDEQASCLAELAGALGVDAILSGTFAQSGNSITATLRVLKATDGSQIAAATSRVKDGEALQDWLDGQALELGQKVRVAFGLAPAPVAAPIAVSAGASGGPGMVRWAPAIVGAGALIGGGVLLGLSKGNAATLKQPLTRDQIASNVSTGRTFEGAGLGLMIAGGAAVAASVVWVLLSPRAEVRVAVVPLGTAGGAAVLGGSF